MSPNKDHPECINSGCVHLPVTLNPLTLAALTLGQFLFRNASREHSSLGRLFNAFGILLILITLLGSRPAPYGIVNANVLRRFYSPKLTFANQFFGMQTNPLTNAEHVRISAGHQGCSRTAS